MKDLCLVNPQLYNMIGEENDRQLQKWGVQDHLPAEWLMFTTEELGELAEAIGKLEYLLGQ